MPISGIHYHFRFLHRPYNARMAPDAVKQRRRRQQQPRITQRWCGLAILSLITHIKRRVVPLTAVRLALSLARSLALAFSRSLHLSSSSSVCHNEMYCCQINELIFFILCLSRRYKLAEKCVLNSGNGMRLIYFVYRECSNKNADNNNEKTPWKVKWEKRKTRNSCEDWIVGHIIRSLYFNPWIFFLLHSFWCGSFTDQTLEHE